MALTQVPIELSSTPGIVDNSNATAITIDSSENVMVNRTSVFTTAKMEIQSDAGDASTLALNSIDTDGSILEFYKAGSTVGSINNFSSTEFGLVSAKNLVLTQNTTTERNLVFSSSYFGSFGADDATIDLGRSVGRFKDLHLSGSVDISQGSKPQSAFLDYNKTILDDAVYSFTPDKTIGVIYIYGRNVNYDERFGIVSYRTSAAAFCTLQLNPSSAIGTSTSVLTGTTGTNGLVTISAVQSDGKIYIENRSGQAISIGIHVTGQ